MSEKKKQSSGGGWVIPLCGPETGRNLIVPSHANEVIKALNALGKLQVIYDEVAPAPFVKYSDGNVVLVLPNPANLIPESSSTSDHPWKITLQDTADGRTFQVGGGNAFLLTRPGHNYAALPLIVSSGTGTNITVPASTTYIVWGEISSGTATVGYDTIEPSDWDTYPQIQGFDPYWPTYSSYKAYFLIGFVVAGTSSLTISQYLFHNPEIPIAASGEVIYQGSWVASTPYRLNSIVRYSGATYLRVSTALGGNDGGTPGASPDWQIIS